MRHGILKWAGAFGAIAVVALPCLPIAQAAVADPSPPFIAPTADWLTSLNYYRAMAHEGPVADNQAWQVGTIAHSCYMLSNGLTHTEIPGAPGYTTEGYKAGISSNVTVSSNINTNQRTHMELWMAAPFHAIGVLRPNLKSTNYGNCTNPGTPLWHSAATLDVIRGLDMTAPDATEPILFPGDGTTTNLTVMSSESPDPLSFCGWSGEGGLPIIAMMPEGFSGTPTASLSTPNGPVQACVLSANNTTGIAHDILQGDNAVLIVPRVKLTTTSYSVSVHTSARTVNWSFNVDPAAANPSSTSPPVPPDPVPDLPPVNTEPLDAGSTLHALVPSRIVDTRFGMGATRLATGQRQRIQVAGQAGVPSDATAVSANFTALGSSAGGFLTVWNCAGPVPNVSTLNFNGGETVPNGASVPLDADGGMCVYANTSTELLVDVNAFYSVDSKGGRFVGVAPSRLMDTRIGLGGSGRLSMNTTVSLRVAGSAGVPSSIQMVVLNVTSVAPATPGYVAVYACDTGQPVVSSLNPAPGVDRPNLVITPVAADGTVCLFASTDVDLIVDITGYISASGTMSFTTTSPFRLTDTRDGTHPEMNSGTGGNRMPKNSVLTIAVAGKRGIAADAKAVSVNVTATDSFGSGYVTVWPCGARPATSTVNFSATDASANGAVVPLSADGTICVFANNDAHVIVDVNGWWS
jgi:hypothetical protein